MKRFADISLKNKIFFSIMAVILAVSIIIGFVARWLLSNTLTHELELRGVALARSVASSGSGYILDKNYPQLLGYIFDVAKLEERKHLIAYIFISTREDKVISHTFTYPFPEKLRLANAVPPGETKSVKRLSLGKQPVYDIAIPINEGIYRIGTTHVGLSKSHIDSLIDKLKFTMVGFLSTIIVVVFFVSHKLAKYITLPLARLIKISNELSRGNFDINLGADGQMPDSEGSPPADPSCWSFDELLASGESPELMRKGDEVIQLANSFNYLFWKIKPYPTQLRETEEKYRSLFDSGPDPIFVVDRETYQIVDANPKAMALYGYQKDELIGLSFLELGHGDDLTRECMSYFENNQDATECIYYPKMLHYKKDGAPVYVNVHACPITYKSKPGIIVEATNITDIVEKDAQLIQASKMKSLGEMSAGVAHEINQPLNAIKLGSEFLSMMIEGGMDIPPEQLREVVSEISTQVDRAAGIINTLRAFGRKSGLIKEKIDINKPIRDVITTVGGQFDLENVKIKLELTEGMSPVLAYDNRLLQVFLNIVTNARDAILEKNKLEGHSNGGLITIRTSQSGGWVAAEIEDSGVGIPEAFRERIFQPFFSTKEAGKGMGLGLAISYGIVKDFSGDIQIQSREGEGTTFKVILPAAPDSTEAITRNNHEQDSDH